MSLISLLTNKDIFPTKWSLFIFVSYMTLFVMQGLLVTGSRQGHKTYPYNPTTVVLLTEIVKLIISSFVYIKNNSISQLLSQILQHSHILAYYMIPAFLYCLYNNLSFTNLAFFDPTTYFLFMQIRLLMTGVIYQFLFKRKLSRMQWFSLLLVTAGCMVQKLDFSSAKDVMLGGGRNPERAAWQLMTISTGFMFIMIQICCSVFAGVYNEHLIKNIAGNDVDIMIQNVFMYLDSILCNLVVLGFRGEVSTAFNATSLSSLWQTLVIAIIINNSLVGIVTSLFLKNLNSILKAFASALELVFTAVLSFVFLGIPVYWNTAVAVAIVSYAVVLYAQNPMKDTTGTTTKEGNKKEKETLIQMEASAKK